MDTWITIIIVLAAGFYVVRRLYENTQKAGNCSCGCSSCDQINDCSSTVNGTKG
ncbi:MAG: FeoB-associated Cys-rich membrane protein [Deltaproteobacteria bacterium]|nr:FeoB-associated Cys-rich membrane protein [Deltaproteobacteria bacterium]